MMTMSKLQILPTANAFTWWVVSSHVSIRTAWPHRIAALGGPVGNALGLVGSRQGPIRSVATHRLVGTAESLLVGTSEKVWATGGDSTELLISVVEPRAIAVTVEVRHLVDRFARRRPVAPARPTKWHDAARSYGARQIEHSPRRSHAPQRQGDEGCAQPHGARGE